MCTRSNKPQLTAQKNLKGTLLTIFKSSNSQ